MLNWLEHSASNSTVPMCKACVESMAAAAAGSAVQLLLCLSAAPNLLWCAFVVWQAVERRAVPHWRAGIVRWARPGAWGALLWLPVCLIAVWSALVTVGVLLHVQPVVSARTEVLQLPVLHIIVVSTHKENSGISTRHQQTIPAFNTHQRQSVHLKMSHL